MKDHSRGRGKRGVGYRTPSLFRANTQQRVRDQQFRNGPDLRSGWRREKDEHR